MSAKDNLFVIAHKFLPQPDDDLVLFLNNSRRKNVVHITHAFSDCPHRRSICKWYKDGELYQEWESSDFKIFPEVIIYLKEFVFTVLCIFKTGTKFNLAVCMDGMCTFFGIFLRYLGRVEKVSYWAIDFVPIGRFKNIVKNFIYRKVNIFGYKNADFVWDLSPRMADARKECLGMINSMYRKHMVVPYGVWTARIKKYSYDVCERNTLVFMGHLLEKQGVQLVLEAIPEIVKKIPEFKFKIIGTGEYECALKEIVEKLSIHGHVKFIGKIEKSEHLEEEIAKSCVAIAPYIEQLDKWTKYADPGKVKTYLACGVPVLLTNVPWNATDIIKKGCGRMIEDSSADIASKTIVLMSRDENISCREKAAVYSQSYDYKNIFEKLAI